MLFDHQKKIVDEDRTKTGLWLGTGSGKTRIALHLAKGKVLIICPKTQKEDGNWERELKEIGLDKDITTISKETFRRDAHLLGKFDTVIVDEAHTVLGVTPYTRSRNKVTIPKTSQLYEALYDFIQRTQPNRIYLVTATIMKSPMTVWAAGKILGKDWNFYKFRDMFYFSKRISMREIYLPKNSDNHKELLAKFAKHIGYTGRLDDYFDVPEQIFLDVYIELTEEQKTKIKESKFDYPETITRVGKIHEIENGILNGDEFSETKVFKNNKIEKILDYAYEYPKMVVFARFTEQINQIASALKEEGYKVLILNGETKDRGTLLKEVNNSEQCVLVCQSSISSGWEVPGYPLVVFASRTYSFVDYDQALGRVQRSKNIKKNIYINLIVKGKTDEAVHKSLLNKQDFNERLFANSEN